MSTTANQYWMMNFYFDKVEYAKIKKNYQLYKGCLENYIMTSPANICVPSKMKLLS